MKVSSGPEESFRGPQEPSGGLSGRHTGYPSPLRPWRENCLLGPPFGLLNWPLWGPLFGPLLGVAGGPPWLCSPTARSTKESNCSQNERSARKGQTFVPGGADCPWARIDILPGRTSVGGLCFCGWPQDFLRPSPSQEAHPRPAHSRATQAVCESLSRFPLPANELPGPQEFGGCLGPLHG